jgi:hypothetical protein
MFYKAVVQSVLLFGCVTWVMSKAIMGSLEGFHHYIAQKWILRQEGASLKVLALFYKGVVEGSHHLTNIFDLDCSVPISLL